VGKIWKTCGVKIPKIDFDFNRNMQDLRMMAIPMIMILATIGLIVVMTIMFWVVCGDEGMIKQKFNKDGSVEYVE